MGSVWDNVCEELLWMVVVGWVVRRACSCFKERGVIDQTITGAHARDSTKTAPVMIGYSFCFFARKFCTFFGRLSYLFLVIEPF